MRRVMLNNTIIGVCLILAFQGCAQAPHGFKASPSNDNVSTLFEGIRKNEALLQYFFSQMPKGGDLHNHLTGSAYAETYFNIALRDSMFLDTVTYVLYLKNDDHKPSTSIQLKPGINNEHAYRLKSIDSWSIRNFNACRQTLPPDEFFFATFGIFGAAIGGNLAELLIELRLRAELENVQYLEIMAASPKAYQNLLNDYKQQNDSLIDLIKKRDSLGIMNVLSNLFSEFEKSDSLKKSISTYVNFINNIDSISRDSAKSVISYYQAYAGRNNKNPVIVFAQAYIGFKSSADSSSKLVGVNIIQPENGDYALRDYWGHMQMFGYLKDKIPGVKTSMHAGELRLGLTPPEDLQNHVDQAVTIAKANRIGHGVDIAFEKNAKEVLSKMANIAIEINLSSNEFILGVKDSEHPIMLYRKSGVPIVLSTDDAGILRTNLTQQFVMAALRYPDLKYEDFRQFVLNSIDYSFMPSSEKTNMKQKLNDLLLDFEKRIASVLFSFNP
ncbi:MAG: hypothetical protein FWC15_07460 [Fibromonadales bacterium]|nr:hypothetical protein [Fibromonadales bacterium]